MAAPERARTPVTNDKANFFPFTASKTIGLRNPTEFLRALQLPFKRLAQSLFCAIDSRFDSFH